MSGSGCTCLGIQAGVRRAHGDIDSKGLACVLLGFSEPSSLLSIATDCHGSKSSRLFITRLGLHVSTSSAHYDEGMPRQELLKGTSRGPFSVCWEGS